MMVARPFAGSDSMDFSGRVACVTGGGSGIGRAVALEFAKRGASVFVVDLNVASAEDTVSLLQEHTRPKQHSGADLYHALGCDVSESDDVKSMVARCMNTFGRLDFCVNCAGIASRVLSLTADLPAASFDEMMKINCRGIFLSMKHQLPALLLTAKQQRAVQQAGQTQTGSDLGSSRSSPSEDLDFQPSIVNIASIAGLSAMPNIIAYAASKAAVISMTKTAGIEYARRVRINCVCPGSVDTPMTQEFARRFPGPSRKVNSSYPVGRIGSASEIARACVWLCSNQCNFMIGQALVIDGGILSKV